MTAKTSASDSTASQSRHVVAAAPLYIGTALAHNVGDLVLQENVGPNGWTKDVAALGTKAAVEALGLDDEPPAG